MSERNISIAVRAHTKLTRKPSDKESPRGKPKEELRLAYGERVMILDTETTVDEFQNLNFGQAYVYAGIEEGCRTRYGPERF